MPNPSLIQAPWFGAFVTSTDSGADDSVVTAADTGSSDPAAASPADAPAVDDVPLSPTAARPPVLGLSQPISLTGSMFKIRLAQDYKGAVRGTPWSYYLPIAPETLTKTSASVKQTFNIIQGGRFVLSTGAEPETIQFAAYLPRNGCNPYLPTSNLTPPNAGAVKLDPFILIHTIRADISNKLPIWVESAEFDILNWYFVDKMDIKFVNMFGDIMIDFTFIEKRTLAIDTSLATANSISSATPPATTAQTTQDPPPDAPAGTDGTSENTNPDGSSDMPKAGQRYTVKPNDTLWAVARRAGLGDNGVADIANLNGIADPNMIRVGQVLQIPTGGAGGGGSTGGGLSTP